MEQNATFKNRRWLLTVPYGLAQMIPIRLSWQVKQSKAGLVG